MSKIGEVVLSAKQIAEIDKRLERCSDENLAEKNYKRHNEWYAAWCKENGVSINDSQQED